MGIVEATVTNKGKKGLIRRFAPYFKKYLWILIFDLFCAALTTVCELALPIIVQQITNRGINDLASLTLSYILRIGGLYIFLKLVDVGATFFMASIGHIMGTKIETDMRRDMFAHLQKLSFSYFDNTKIGQLMSRITTDLFDITEFAHHCPEEFFIAGIKIIGAFVILCTMSVPLTLIIFAVLPFMLASLLIDGPQTMLASLQHIDLLTILSLLYLAFIATIVGYGIWGSLLGRYETWRVAPLSLLVPVVGMASAALLLGETLSGLQLTGAVLIMAGLYINVFGLRLVRPGMARG